MTVIAHPSAYGNLIRGVALVNTAVPPADKTYLYPFPVRAAPGGWERLVGVSAEQPDGLCIATRSVKGVLLGDIVVHGPVVPAYLGSWRDVVPGDQLVCYDDGGEAVWYPIESHELGSGNAVAVTASTQAGDEIIQVALLPRGRGDFSRGPLEEAVLTITKTYSIPAGVTEYDFVGSTDDAPPIGYNGPLPFGGFAGPNANIGTAPLWIRRSAMIVNAVNWLPFPDRFRHLGWTDKVNNDKWIPGQPFGQPIFRAEWDAPTANSQNVQLTYTIILTAVYSSAGYRTGV